MIRLFGKNGVSRRFVRPHIALRARWERLRSRPGEALRAASAAVTALSVALALFVAGDLAVSGIARLRPALPENGPAPAASVKPASKKNGRGRSGAVKAAQAHAASVQAQTAPAARAAAAPAMSPFSYYEGVIKQRNLFQMSAAADAGAAGPQSSRLGQLAANYSVDAIFLDESTRAIILDRRVNESISVTVGQYVGQLRVKAIEKRAVMLEYRGEELKLEF